MRRIALLLLLTLGLPAAALVADVGLADAHRGTPVDAEFIARLHQRHGHTQFRGGDGTPGHTWTAYRREARRLRAYLRAVQLNRQREALVDRWRGVAQCESGGNWHINTGNGHYGGLQFSLSTWRAHGGSGLPHEAAPWRQAEVGERVRASSGLGAWPHCGRYYG